MAFATWGRGESRRSCVKVRVQALERARGGQRGLLVRARRSAPPEDEARAHRPILCPAGTPGRAARDQAAPAILDVKVLLTPKKSPCTASVARGPHSRLVCPFFVNKRAVSSLNAPSLCRKPATRRGPCRTISKRLLHPGSIRGVQALRFHQPGRRAPVR